MRGPATTHHLSHAGLPPRTPLVWLRSPRFFTPYCPTRTRQESHAPSLNGDRQSSQRQGEGQEHGSYRVRGRSALPQAPPMEYGSLPEPVKSACGVPSGSATPPLDRTRPTRAGAASGDDEQQGDEESRRQAQLISRSIRLGGAMNWVRRHLPWWRRRPSTVGVREPRRPKPTLPAAAVALREPRFGDRNKLGNKRTGDRA